MILCNYIDINPNNINNCYNIDRFQFYKNIRSIHLSNKHKKCIIQLNKVKEYNYKYNNGIIKVKENKEYIGLDIKYIINNKEYLPIIIYTIVINGMPFITYHFNIFKETNRYFQWHIIEGFGVGLENKNRYKKNMKLNEKYIYKGLSTDGTTLYLNKLKNENKEEVFIHRREYGNIWSNKSEMIRITHNINFKCVLIEIDVDELWNSNQIIKISDLFEETNKRCMFFHCHYFITPSYVTITKNVPTHANSYEWLRAWIYEKGDIWKCHEPPFLYNLNTKTYNYDKLFGNKCLKHDFTEMNGLVFTHYSWTEENIVKFKEDFYEKEGLYNKWKEVENYKGELPFEVSKYFYWFKKGTYIDKPENDPFGRNVSIIPYPKYNIIMKEKRLILNYYDRINNKEIKNRNIIFDITGYFDYPFENELEEYLINYLKQSSIQERLFLSLEFNYKHTFLSKFITIWNDEGNEMIMIEKDGLIYGYIEIIKIDPYSTMKHRLNVLLSYNPTIIYYSQQKYIVKSHNIIQYNIKYNL